MPFPETRQLEERTIQSPFRIALPDPEALFDAISHNGQMDNGEFKPALKIGFLRSEIGLFSKISIEAQMMQDAYLLPGGYRMVIRLKYRNAADQYWPKEQTKQLESVLRHDFPNSDILFRYKVNEKNHSQLTVSPITKLVYVIDLGPQNERIEWENQIEEDYKALAGEQELEDFMKKPYPRPIWSSIAVKPIDIHSIHDYQLFPFTALAITMPNLKDYAINLFTNTTVQWALHAENFVNAMAKVKGIPQSGKLTLLPPSEIPQQ